jgi:hypothetical protein
MTLALLATAFFAKVGHAQQHQVPCGIEGTSPVRISSDSLGALWLWSDIEAVRARCPIAKDTVHYGEATETGVNTYPAIVIHLANLKVLGIQWKDSLDVHAPMDVWGVYGSNGVLPGGVSLAATWSELRHYGEGIVEMGDARATVMFCEMPRLFFDLRGTTPLPVGPYDRHDLSPIPSAWTISDIFVTREDGAGWRC